MSEIKVKQPIVLSLTAGKTINIGNYESIRVSVGLSVPIYSPDKLNSIYEKVSKKVEKLLDTEIKKAEKKHKKENKENFFVEELIDE